MDEHRQTTKINKQPYHVLSLPTSMESKLKALKVVDLRAILTKAEQPAPAKSNKQDLISRILASKEALEAYKNEHEKSEQDDLLAPPEE